MSDRQTDTALGGIMVIALAALVCLSIGVSLEFGGGWALIVDGVVFFVYSLVIALKRSSQTLLFADSTTNQLRK